MKKYTCDINGCEEEAIRHDIDVCNGYMASSGVYKSEKITTYEPFEKPSIQKYDLCEKHFRQWCKATYDINYTKSE